MAIALAFVAQQGGTALEQPHLTPAAATKPVTASVGPLFVAGSSNHTCTGSVVASPHGNVIVTAAHCLSGTGRGTLFQPGYANGVAPYGTWKVTGTYVDSSWLTSQSAQADYAFATVAPVSGTRSVQSVVGASTLATAPKAGTKTTVTGYAKGSGDTPIVCTTTTYKAGSFPAFACDGYVSGTSGSPWVTTSRALVGVIGGLHQGGCRASVSYTSAFTAKTEAVLKRAASAAKPDVLPKAGPDGC